MTFRTLIVDDESSACDLDRMLTRIQAPFKIIGKASNGFDAIRIINNLKPDLVFFDMKLSGINGGELLNRCKFNPYIILTTTIENHATSAYEEKSISYLVKPISEKRLVTAIIKFLKMPDVSPKPVPIKRPAKLPFLPVKNGDAIFLIPTESIVWISAEGKYTIIATKEKEYISNYSISEVEKRLNQPSFLRVHRSYIVNLKHIVEFRRIGTNKLRCITSPLPDENIFVSKNYYDNLMERLNMN